MRNINKIIFSVIALAIFGMGQLHAEKLRGEKRAIQQRASGTCLPAANSNELTINNVRAYLETNGTMWFVETAEYEVPKGSGKTSMFCAALWIGGRDVNAQLKLAAVRFRQIGDDFWTGPLSTVDASVSQETCIEYDRFFKITREQVENHIANWDDPEYNMPAIIRNWPAHGDDISLGQSLYLAPYFDVEDNGVYEPEKGDYPYYDLENDLCPWTDANKALAAAGLLPKTPEELRGISSGMVYADHVLKGDETLFWIFNDKGGPHTESGGNPIGLEIRGQAFGFATNDELNNMTFYSYEIINRSSYELTNTFFSQWVDPDLGFAKDDYVGCDVARGLGYCYNGKDVDGEGQTWAYGSQPPAIGVDFFQGPYMDPDGKDNPKFYIDSVNYPGYCEKFVNDEFDQMAINGVNFGDGIVDNERFGMRRFVYHNNDNSETGDPSTAYQYYNMLQGIWKDNVKMRYGKNAHPNNGANGPECDFMFPGTTDPCNWGTKGIDPDINQYGSDGWVEGSVPNAPEDRRFMQSAGPFTLKSGAVNYITVGIPWARAASGGAWESVKLLKIADDKCQNLFENCFKVLDGPDAPDLTIRELENELILYLTNDDPLSNNYQEKYVEMDNTIPESREIVTSIETIDTIFLTQFGLDTFILDTNIVTQTTKVDNDREYRFEGYKIYQLKNKDVSVTDLDNADMARLVRQCDIENTRPDGSGIGKLVNWIYNDAIATSVATEMVDGANAGISHSFSITEDAFATGARALVNHKVYYFMVIAYAYNEFAPYSIENGLEGLDGQKTPYLAGRKNIKVYSAIPHSSTPHNEGVVLNAEYGTQPMITRIEGQGNGGFFLDLTDETREKILKEKKVSELTYKNNYGPLNIKVVDPLRLKPFDYEIKFIDGGIDVTDTTRWVMTIVNATDEEIIDAGLYTENAGTRIAIREFASETSISEKNEQLFLDLGISVSIMNYDFKIHQDEIKKWVDAGLAPGNSYVQKSRYAQVDFVGATISYADPSRPWYGGIIDNEGDYPDNWIRSGQQSAGAWQDTQREGNGVKDNYSQWKREDFFFVILNSDLNPSGWETKSWKDPRGQFEGALNGTWAPYVLTSPYYGGPQAKYITTDLEYNAEPNPSYYEFKEATSLASHGPGYNQTMTNLYSVDVVMTPDKDKWTRCIVLEACEDATLSEGGALRHEPRKAPSVDKQGIPLGQPGCNEWEASLVSTTGMGWFPGYAINVETGERLNIMFSENSSDTVNNGRDMLFNPTSTYGYVDYGDTTYEAGQSWYNSTFFSNYENLNIVPSPSWGGMHFVYVCNSAGNTASSFYKSTGSFLRRLRNFNDGGEIVHSAGSGIDHGGVIGDEGLPYYECGVYDEGKWLWTKFSTFVDNAVGTSSGIVKQRKMELFNNVMWTSIATPAYGQEANWLSNEAIVKLRVSRPYMRYTSRWWENPASADAANQNAGFPMYSFTTKNIAPTKQTASVHEQILKEINVVPNPYYGFSTYETTMLETYVKIVNLPEKCNISIFTVNGLLVKKISKGDAESTHVTWDLKNSANVPISSGMYIIHVDAPGIGERTLKFFCAMRPTDLNAF